MSNLNKNPKFLQAFEMLNNGYNVIPFTAEKKFNLLQWKEFEKKKVTEKDIEEWWTKYPDANVAIITGEISGVTVVDFDVGDDGLISPKQRELADQLPETLTVKTPSGGFHLYYKYNPNFINSSNKELGIDVRNNGGLTGGWDNYCEYTKSSGTEIKGWYKKVTEVSSEIVELPTEILKSILDKPFAKAHHYTDEVKDWTLLPKGDRNNYFYFYARTLFEKGLNGSEITDYFKLKYEKLENKKAFDWKEVEVCIKSASKYKKTTEIETTKLIDGLEIRKELRTHIVEVSVATGKVNFSFSEIIRAKQSFEAVIKIEMYHSTEGLLPAFEQRIDLNSASAVSNLATALNSAFGNKKEGYNWVLLLNKAGVAIKKLINEEKRPSQFEENGDYSYKESVYLVKSFLEEGVANMIHGDAGTGKSYFCLMMAAQAYLGQYFFGYKSQTFRTLYLDWEDTEQSFNSRIHRIANSMPDVSFKDIREGIDYYKPEGSLVEEGEIIARFVEEKKYELIIIDAGGDATGGSPLDEQAVLRMFHAMDRIPCTKLIIHHEPKHTLGVASDKTYYGTTYWKAKSRVVWRLTTENLASDGSKTIKAEMTKANNSKLESPFHFMLKWDTQPPYGMTMNQVEVEKEENSFHSREGKILDLLENDGAMSETTLISGTRESRSEIKRLLTGLEKKGKIEKKRDGKKYIYDIKKGVDITAEFNEPL